MNPIDYRDIAYIGFGFWGLLLLFFIIWRAVVRYSPNRSMKRTNVDTAKKPEFDSVEQLKKGIKKFDYLLYFLRCFLVYFSLWMLLMAYFGLTTHIKFITCGITLVAFVLPSYFGGLFVKSVFTDILNSVLKRREEME